MSFDGHTWTWHDTLGRPVAIEVDASGTVWITLDESDRTAQPSSRRSPSLGPDGTASDARKGRLVASPSGKALVVETDTTFWTLDGEEWTKVAPREDIGISFDKEDLGLKNLVFVDDDGRIWMTIVTERGGPYHRGDAVALLDSDAWAIEPRVDGRDWGDLVDVAADGSAWFAGVFDQLECGQGLPRFDGTTWEQHLDGHCPTSIGLASDGTVWVQAFEVPENGWGGRVDTFVITSGAVGTAE